MCSSEVEREIKTTTMTFILCVCCCHLPPAVWQRQAMCSSEVEREIKTTTMTFILLCAVVTYILQCGRDRQCVVVKWGGR